MHEGHLAVNPKTSKSSRVMSTLFGNRTCSSISSYSSWSVSIFTTSPLRCSSSIMASSSFLRHGSATIISGLLRSHLSLAVFLQTVLVHHKPFRFPTMTAPVVAWMPKDTPSFQMHVNFPSKPPARLLLHRIPSANDTPCTIVLLFLSVARTPFCRRDRLRCESCGSDLFGVTARVSGTGSGLAVVVSGLYFRLCGREGRGRRGVMGRWFRVWASTSTAKQRRPSQKPAKKVHASLILRFVVHIQFYHGGRVEARAKSVPSHPIPNVGSQKKKIPDERTFGLVSARVRRTSF